MTLFDDVRGPSWTLRTEPGLHATDDPQAAPAPPLYLQQHDQTLPVVFHPVQHSLPQHRMRNVPHMFECTVPLSSISSMDAQDWWNLRVRGSDRLVALTATFDHAARDVQHAPQQPRVWTFIGVLFWEHFLLSSTYVFVTCIVFIHVVCVFVVVVVQLCYLLLRTTPHRGLSRTPAVPCTQRTSLASTRTVAPAHGI